jgi:hypothetical protein
MYTFTRHVPDFALYIYTDGKKKVKIPVEKFDTFEQLLELQFIKSFVSAWEDTDFKYAKTKDGYLMIVFLEEGKKKHATLGLVSDATVLSSLPLWSDIKI